MKTPEQWLQEVKASPEKLKHWLGRQYVGEALAADRIQQLADQCVNRSMHVLQRIADDERKHTEWVKELLAVRNIELPELSMDGTRYWEPILDHLHSFEEVAGAGHHAETMRLARIRMLAEDLEIDSDIREVFKKILPDEEFHARAFAAMSTAEAIETTRKLHNAGLDLLGLEV